MDNVYEEIHRLLKEVAYWKAEAQHYKKAYTEVLDRSLKEAQDNTAALLGAILSGAFAKGEGA